MNRAFLLILIPTALVAAFYVVVARHFGMHLHYGRLAGAVVGFVVAAAAVHYHRRRKARPSGG